MNVISKKTVRDAIKIYPDSAEQLSLLYRDLKRKIFENVNQVKDCFPYVSILKNNRVVFNVCGNKYRVVVLFNFNVKVCYVRFIGTHADYDKIDANSV
jgi:mRNA interferase HigB